MLRQISVLLRKELRESIWFLAAGLAIFVAWPLYDMLAATSRQMAAWSTALPNELMTSLAPVLAILLAIGATCRDLDEPLAVFWRSRPIGTARWLAVKFAAGLAILFVVFALSMAVQVASDTLLFYRHPYYPGEIQAMTRGLHPNGSTLLIIAAFSFCIVLLYSLSFALGCLVRRPVQATMLALIVAIVFLFLPVVLPPLAALSAVNIVNDASLEVYGQTSPDIWRIFLSPERIHLPGTQLWMRLNPQYWAYVSFTLILSATAVLVAWLAVRRDWRVRLDARTMCWVLGGAGLIFFATAAFQIGTNMELVKEIKSPHGHILRMALDPVTGRGIQADPGAMRKPEGTWEYPIWGVLVNDGEPVFGKSPAWIDLPAMEPGPNIELRSVAPLPGRTGPFCFIADVSGLVPETTETGSPIYVEDAQGKHIPLKQKRYRLDLIATEISPKGEVRVLGRVEIRKHCPWIEDRWAIPGAAQAGNKVYVYSSYDKPLLEVDFSNPAAPAARLLEINPGQQLALSGAYDGGTGRVGDAPRLEFSLLRIPGLTPRERLRLGMDLTASNTSWRNLWEGDRMVRIGRDGNAAVYRLLYEGQNSIEFEKAGQRHGTPVERLAAGFICAAGLRDGLAAVLDYGEGGLTVYDVRDAARPRRVGHYTAPDDRFRSLVMLSEGRVLLETYNLHLLAAPRLSESHLSNR